MKNCFNNKKAAMFGLDARIALAIFAALSVITGAALYSAIKHAKIIAIVNEVSELAKAYEAYYLDIGSPIRKVIEVDAAHPNKVFALYAKDLTEDPGFPGWKGPYTKLATHSTLPKTAFAPNNLTSGYILIMADSGTWGAASGTPSCSVAETCNFWIQIATRSADTATAIDQYIDGSTTLDTGKIRIRNVSPLLAFYNTGIRYTGM